MIFIRRLKATQGMTATREQSLIPSTEYTGLLCLEDRLVREICQGNMSGGLPHLLFVTYQRLAEGYNGSR